MAAADVPLQACNLSKSFGRRGVLRGIDLTLRPGHYVGLMGINGAGKTTLLRCLAALVRPTAGSVFWFGRPAAAQPRDRCLVGMVGHETRLYPQLTVRENLLFAARMYAVPAAVTRVNGLLEEMGLLSHAERYPLPDFAGDATACGTLAGTGPRSADSPVGRAVFRLGYRGQPLVDGCAAWIATVRAGSLLLLTRSESDVSNWPMKFSSCVQANLQILKMRGGELPRRPNAPSSLTEIDRKYWRGKGDGRVPHALSPDPTLFPRTAETERMYDPSTPCEFRGNHDR